MMDSDFIIKDGILEKYVGQEANVVIPDSVAEIGGLVFSFCMGLKNIDIPNSVTKIGDGAFANCTGLRDIKVPDTTEIGRDAFALCDNISVNYRGNTYTKANIKELYAI